MSQAPRVFPILRNLSNLSAVVLAVLVLSGCASSEYMGISLRPGTAATDFQDLARRAQAGDKQAQLELGVRYEEGLGVSVDLGRAKKLYEAASRDSGGPKWVYSPSPGGGAPARVLPFNRVIELGLAEAKRRLKAISGDVR